MQCVRISTMAVNGGVLRATCFIHFRKGNNGPAIQNVTQGNGEIKHDGSKLSSPANSECHHWRHGLRGFGCPAMEPRRGCQTGGGGLSLYSCTIGSNTSCCATGDHT